MQVIFVNFGVFGNYRVYILYIAFSRLKMRYSPYVNKGFVYISVSKILNFIRQLFIFS